MRWRVLAALRRERFAYRRLGLDDNQLMQRRAALSLIGHSKSCKKTPADVYSEAKDPRSILTIYRSKQPACSITTKIAASMS